MEHIPDPIEIMDAHIERMCDEFDEVHCMRCGKATEIFFPAYNAPDAPAVCEECAAGSIGRSDLQPLTQQGQNTGSVVGSKNL
jgi:hypothetical protein